MSFPETVWCPNDSVSALKDNTLKSKKGGIEVIVLVNSHSVGDVCSLLTFQIIPFKRDSLQSQVVAGDVSAATDVFRFTPSLSVEFKRELTVKLPLPLSADDDQHISSDDVAVCQTMTSQDGGDWTVLDGPLKLTKNSVAFETRTLTK